MQELKQIKLIKELEQGIVKFDNSDNGFAANTVKEAIEEVNNKLDSIDVEVNALEVSYTDNKSLNASNTQEAIDKLKDYTDEHIRLSKEELQSYLQEQLQSLSFVDIEISEFLPGSGEEKILYLVGGTNTNYVFEMYIWKEGAFRPVGATKVDLSQYAQKSELPTNLSQLVNDTGFITLSDIPPSSTEASGITYIDNRAIGATNVQEALDKTADKLKEVKNLVPQQATELAFTSSQNIIATNVGDALDELKSELGSIDVIETAEEISYDDSDTQLGVSNVQMAIKSIKTIVDGLQLNVEVNASQVEYDNSISQLSATDVKSALDELDNILDEKGLGGVQLSNNQW